MSNPFDRNKTKEAKLGELITEVGEQNQRDAVHIAIVPIKAHARLRPGEAVGVTSDGKNSAFNNVEVGIVDPYLKKAVEKGQTFWLFLYQGSVNTLRHEWTHPAFPSHPMEQTVEPVFAGSEEEKKLSYAEREKAMSEVWLRAYAMRVNHYYDPDEAYSVLVNDLKSGTLVYHGTDMHSRGELLNEAELKHHAEIVLGQTIDFDGFEYFSCSC
jgi:hypothetical protein